MSPSLRVNNSIQSISRSNQTRFVIFGGKKKYPFKNYTSVDEKKLHQEFFRCSLAFCPRERIKMPSVLLLSSSFSNCDEALNEITMLQLWRAFYHGRYKRFCFWKLENSLPTSSHGETRCGKQCAMRRRWVTLSTRQRDKAPAGVTHYVQREQFQNSTRL